tara:strand:- start:126 stop:518 length:393 start_codon:yes stop_codon:yes gene_type:complete
LRLDPAGRAIANAVRLDRLRQLVRPLEDNVVNALHLDLLERNVVNAFPRFDRLGHLVRNRTHNDGRAIARALRLDRLKQLVRTRQQEHRQNKTRQQERRQNETRQQEHRQNNNEDFRPLYESDVFRPSYG